jgi:hypothetical protein
MRAINDRELTLVQADGDAESGDGLAAAGDQLHKNAGVADVEQAAAAKH